MERARPSGLSRHRLALAHRRGRPPERVRLVLLRQRALASLPGPPPASRLPRRSDLRAARGALAARLSLERPLARGLSIGSASTARRESASGGPVSGGVDSRTGGLLH